MSENEVKRSSALGLKAGLRALVKCILDWFLHAELVNCKAYSAALIPLNLLLQTFLWAKQHGAP